MSDVTTKDIDRLFKLIEIADVDPAEAGDRAGVSSRAWMYWRAGERVPYRRTYDKMWGAVVDLARIRMNDRAEWARKLPGKVAGLGVEL